MDQQGGETAERSNGCPMSGLLFGAGARTVTGDIGLAITRIGIGLYMALGHGYGKMFGENRFGPSENFVGVVGELGFPAPEFFAWMAALTEFFGGLALAAGLLTRPMALAMIGTMAVAAFIRHGSDPWVGDPSKELALLYLLPSIALLALGGGRLSADAILRKLVFRGH